MSRLLPLLAALVIAASPAAAQLAFEAERHDFGTIEEGDVATHAFRFTNAGEAPVSLAEVAASCGCTTPSYTDTPVAPGDTGRVVVAYASAGRPGPFERRIRVTAEGADPVTLRIAGTVVPAWARSGVRLGAFVFNRQTAELGGVEAGQPAQASFRLWNSGERPVRLRRVEAPAGVEVVFPQWPVFPGATGGLFVTVDDAGRLAEGGAFRVPLDVWTEGADEPARLWLTGVLTAAGGR
jgi:hypothetical protein